jgi:hypothetical protein
MSEPVLKINIIFIYTIPITAQREDGILRVRSRHKSPTTFGQNIFRGTAEIGQGPTQVPNIYGNTILQGVKNNVLFTDLTASYLINTRTNMRLELSFSRRTQSNLFIEKAKHFFSDL